MNTETIIEFFKRTNDILNMLVDICKDAWAQPHTPALLAIAVGAFALLIVWRKIRNHFKPIK